MRESPRTRGLSAAECPRKGVDAAPYIPSIVTEYVLRSARASDHYAAPQAPGLVGLVRLRPAADDRRRRVARAAAPSGRRPAPAVARGRRSGAGGRRLAHRRPGPQPPG